MTTKIEKFFEPFLRKELPDIRPGDTVIIHQKVKETTKKNKSSSKQEDKERTQTFEGLVLARKHGKGISATITVRKVISGIGVEKIFPLHSPSIEKIEILKRGKIRRAKLYYLRKAKGKKATLKSKEI
jgi:large subunit ribosomal protein L19